MNPLRKLPWFFPGMGAFLYLTGMNDEFLHIVGDLWLDVGRWGQTGLVIALLALVAYFTLGRIQPPALGLPLGGPGRRHDPFCLTMNFSPMKRCVR